MARAWTQSVAEGLRNKPGTHHHPTEAGLYLRVGKTKATWGFKFRVGDRQESGRLGDADEIKVDKAVALYRAIRRRYANPGTWANNTVAAAFDNWLENARKKRHHGGAAKSDLTKRKYRQWFDRHIKATAGGWILADTKTTAWLELLLIARARSMHEARAAYWVMHGMYAYYVAIKAIDDNPLKSDELATQLAGADTIVHRTTKVHALDLPQLLLNVSKLRGKGTQELILMLLMLGWRKTCVLQMKWAQIDFKQSIYNVLPGDCGWKTHSGEVALNEYAMGYLRTQRKRVFAGDYVFPAGNVRSKTPYRVDFRGALKTASRGLPRVITAHDLRRTFITVGDIVTDGNLRLVGRLVGHSQKSSINQGDSAKAGSSTTSGYVIVDIEEECEVSRLIAETLFEVGDALPMSEETVAMFKKRKIDLSYLLPKNKAKGDTASPIDLIPVEDDDDGT